MAIPKGPIRNNPGNSSRNTDNENIDSGNSIELPEIDLSDFHETAPEQPQKPQRVNSPTQPRQAAQAPRKRPQRAPEPVAEPEPVDDGWKVDKKTGKRYKSLTASPKEAISANKKNKGGGLTLDQMSRFTEIDEDFGSIDSFSGNDLDSVAAMFLPHLQVPPDKREIAQLKEARIKRAREQDKILAANQEKFEDDGTNV